MSRSVSVCIVEARRVILDTIEVLFSGLSNEMILRAELKRLFNCFKFKGVTAIVTGEHGERTLTRFGLEEYVADCVILLSHIVKEPAPVQKWNDSQFAAAFVNVRRICE